jgi:NADH-quinone oxidoreductase subunit C
MAGEDAPAGAVVESPAESNIATIVLRERLPHLRVVAYSSYGQDWVVVPAEGIVETLRVLRDDPRTVFDAFIDVTAVDLLPRAPRWEVVYTLLSIRRNARFRVKVEAPDGPTPEVPSATAVYPAANWYEREVYDLMGISFAGHPDLRRIFLPDDWQGHPMRFDHPLGGEEVGFTS